MSEALQFRRRGFVVVRSLLSIEDAEHYQRLLVDRSGIDPATYGSTGRGRTSWNHTDGVTKDEAFWDLIEHPRLRFAVGRCIGDGFKYLQHSDLQVGFSAVAWHRDNVNRTYGIGPDWDESDGPYGLVRVGIYLQRHAESGFRLGFIPGSHRMSSGTGGVARSLSEWRYKAQGGLALLGPRFQALSRSAEWVATEPGDAIIFDPRILHSGSYIEGLKLSMFAGFGQENRHFTDLSNYYRHVRTELGYGEIPDALARRLEAAGLLAGSHTGVTDIEHAYVPPALLRRAVARRIEAGNIRR